MSIRMYRFDTWVSRETRYPFDVILRKGPVYAFVSARPESSKVLPIADTVDYYKRWPYGHDWQFVWVPGETRVELIFDNFFRNHAQEV